ncbi:MAG: class I poly(R)-hydroxyalkanoic acid synthase, partial [Orrella sp.]
RWQAIAQAAAAGELPMVADRRFKGQAWGDSPMHLLMAHLYLLSGEAMKQLVETSQAEPAVKDQLRFSVMQWVDAVSPANFLATNPEAQQALLQSGGQSLQAGICNFLEDLQKGRITHTDETQFEVGRNLAVSPGAVVFRNKYFELIQYQPKTKTVFSRPLLMVAPCINKYYILDLQPENSLVNYLVSEGFTVFVVSWRNPLPGDTDGIELAGWDDYIEEGLIKAIKVARDISRQPKINVLGFCVGGTMLSTALAVLAAKRQSPAASMTLLATMLDFVDTGALGVFANEPHAQLREQAIGQGGLMTALELSNTFSALRPNELIWNYVVSNYLKGQTPIPFDLLYWNGDGTNLPGPFFTWYFRNTYIENKLCQPGALQVCGKNIDFGKIKIPAYIQASKEDHIVPWKTAYLSSHLLTGPVRFVLGASGHIAGVINPVSKNKRSYWTSEHATDVAPGDWFDSATEHPGSWWSDYVAWLKPLSGKRVSAPKALGSAELPPLEPAPGSYVKVRAV